MKPAKPLELNIFLKKYEKFISIETWTKQKYQIREEVDEILNFSFLTSIRVGKNSKYNYCISEIGEYSSQVFTIFKVPKKQLGKLFPYRNKWVLIRCNADHGGWSVYFNYVYLLSDEFDSNRITEIKNKFGIWFVEKLNDDQNKNHETSDLKQGDLIEGAFGVIPDKIGVSGRKINLPGH